MGEGRAAYRAARRSLGRALRRCYPSPAPAPAASSSPPSRMPDHFEACAASLADSSVCPGSLPGYGDEVRRGAGAAWDSTAQLPTLRLCWRILQRQDLDATPRSEGSRIRIVARRYLTGSIPSKLSFSSSSLPLPANIVCRTTGSLCSPVHRYIATVTCSRMAKPMRLVAAHLCCYFACVGGCAADCSISAVHFRDRQPSVLRSNRGPVSGAAFTNPFLLSASVLRRSPQLTTCPLQSGGGARKIRCPTRGLGRKCQLG